MKPDPDRTANAGGLHDEVAGERPAPLIAQALSLQTRFSNYIALGLIALIGVALLLWYYTHAATPLKAHAQHRTASVAASDDLMAPSIGPIRLALAGAPSSERSDRDGRGVASSAAGPVDLTPTSAPLTRALSADPLTEGLDAAPAGPSHAAGGAVPTAYQRRTSGDAFLSADSVPAAMAVPVLTSTQQSTVPPPETSVSRSAAPRADAEALTGLLSHSSTSIETATMLPTLSLLLPRGAFIDCTLETAIDSTLPGMTSCITATDTFGADGQVVLLERGTRLIGETQGQVQQGAARVFVLWTEARTPAGVSVPLDSPGTDELGRSGLSGQVDRHFWQRFGAAVLLSVIDGAVQAGVQAAATDRSGTVIYNPGGSQDVMSEILKGTVSIPPTVVKSNGDRIQIFVARDVDFRGVYELQAKGSAH